MNVSTTEVEPGLSDAVRERALIRRFCRQPLGPYDAELQAFLLPLRNLPALGKHALMRLPARQAWTLVRLGGRGRPVQMLGGCWQSTADAEWALFRARWQDLRGWDPQTLCDLAASGTCCTQDG